MILIKEVFVIIYSKIGRSFLSNQKFNLKGILGKTSSVPHAKKMRLLDREKKRCPHVSNCRTCNAASLFIMIPEEKEERFAIV